MNESAATAPRGRASHRRISVPAIGKADASTVACRSTRRRLVIVDPSATQTLTDAGIQPRSFDICAPSRRRRSIVPMSSLTSTSADLSSTTSRDRESACQARMSTTPRSPKIEKETSGTATQPGSRENDRAIVSCIAVWAASMSRSASPPRQRVTIESRTSSVFAMSCKVPSVTDPARPCSIRATVDRDKPARRRDRPAASRAAAGPDVTRDRCEPDPRGEADALRSPRPYRRLTWRSPAPPS